MIVYRLPGNRSMQQLIAIGWDLGLLRPEKLAFSSLPAAC